MKTNQKLTLKKEKIAALSNHEMSHINGGQADGNGNSTKKNFTCGWCTNTTVDTGDIIAATIKITPHL